jgi:hypothetical protein
MFLVTCEWFAMCANETDEAADHPILGPVPICPRCAKKMEITPQYKIINECTVEPMTETEISQ